MAATTVEVDKGEYFEVPKYLVYREGNVSTETGEGDLRRVVACVRRPVPALALRHPPPEGVPSDLPLLIGEAVFEKVLQTFDPADDSRYTLLRSRIPSPEAIEAAIDLDDPEIVQRLTAVYDRAEELLQERLAKRSQSRRRSAGDDVRDRR